jgi:hypothetical protein
VFVCIEERGRKDRILTPSSDLVGEGCSIQEELAKLMVAIQM